MSTQTQPQQARSLLPTSEYDIAVVGLGYVGLPLSLTFADAGLRVIGVDVNPEIPEMAKNKKSWIDDIDDAYLATHVNSQAFVATNSVEEIAKADAVIIAVPTPLNRNREPDLSMIEAAARSIEPHLQSGQLIVLESTTWPGTTREILQPIFENEINGVKKRTVGIDFYLAYSPERVDPGNETWHTRNIPKVVGGVTPACTTRVQEVYGRAIETIHPVSSPETAEMEKLFENIFRNVNMALVNELAMLCDRMGINVWEVIDAAATKPFGYMKFQPGPGLGGHCIPIDPFYLSWKAREFDFSTEFIELAGKINSNMPYHCVRKLRKALDANGLALRGSNVLAIGVAYKKDISDYRESAAIKILELLQKRGVNVSYHDTFVPVIENGHGIVAPEAPADRSVELTEQTLQQSDAVIILTDHSDIDWELILKHAPIIIDYRNVYPQQQTSSSFWRL